METIEERVNIVIERAKARADAGQPIDGELAELRRLVGVSWTRGVLEGKYREQQRAFSAGE